MCVLTLRGLKQRVKSASLTNGVGTVRFGEGLLFLTSPSLPLGLFLCAYIILTKHEQSLENT